MDRTTKFWDKQAKSYDEGESRFEPAFAIILEKTNKFLKKTDTVLDFGCATGNKAFQLAPNVKKVNGIDISPKMIAEADKQAAEMKVSNVSFIVGSIFDSNLKRKSYDVIISYGVLHLLKDLPHVLEQIMALLKPGGLFISTTACLKNKMTIRSRIEFSMYMFAKKIGLFPIYLNLFTSGDVRDLISGAGFSIVEDEDVFYGINMYFAVAIKKS